VWPIVLLDAYGGNAAAATTAAATMSSLCGGETRLFAMPFYTKNDHFTKTGSGET
jgi:hypothetical protein